MSTPGDMLKVYGMAVGLLRDCGYEIRRHRSRERTNCPIMPKAYAQTGWSTLKWT